jgi:hypothetical protein
LSAFGPALGNDQTCLDCLSEAYLVSEDATSFAKPPQSKDYRVDLVRIRIDARLPLGSRVALQIVWSADTHEILSQNPPIERVESHASVSG